MKLAERLDKLIQEEKLFELGDRILVAVSGGPDSTALLQLLFLLSTKWRWELIVAHANHGFRPEESEQEAKFVRRLAEERGLRYCYKELHVPRYLEEEGGNPQEVARKLRYEFLRETASSVGASRIALAHHADDQAETVLMRVLRGTGISGLRGIPLRRMEQNLELIRPLLRINKNELIMDLEQSGLDYCVDSSNHVPKYTRNKIRLELIPNLAVYNPSLSDALNRLADLAAADDDYLEQEAAAVYRRLVVRRGRELHFSRSSYTELHAALQRRFIKLILNYLSPGKESHDFAVVEQIRYALDSAARPNMELELPGKVRMLREYEEVRFWSMEVPAQAALLPAKGDRGPYERTLELSEGEVELPEVFCRLSYGFRSALADRDNSSEGFPSTPSMVCFDAEALDYPLQVRSRRDGDRMRIMGLNGTKKVKDIFIDSKVPAAERDRLPLLVDGEGRILWIPGVRRSAWALVTEDTAKVLWFRFEPQ